jgi:hypothetical protein
MRRICVVALLLATAGAAARGGVPTCDVDVELAGSAKVRGSIRPAAQCESFVLDLPRLAAVTATATARGAGSPAPRLVLVADAGGTPTQGRPVTGGAKLTATAASSGVHRLTVTGDGVAEGDYALALKVVPRARWQLADTATPGVENTASFAAPAGASARVRLTRPRGSSFVPDLVAIDGPGGFEAPLAGGGTSALVPLGAAGEYVVRFNGGAGGAWAARIDVVPPAAAVKSIDVTDAALTGDTTAGTPVFARIVGPSGGTVSAASPGTTIAGSSCTVPPNAVAVRSLVSIAGGRRFGVGAGVHATGPYVRLACDSGPFLAPVVVVVPFDPGAYTDAASQMTIWCRDETGALTSVAGPYDFGGAAGFVAFTTSRTGTIVTTNTRPRPVVGSWKLLRFSNDAQDGYIGSVTCTISDATATPGHLDVQGAGGARSTWTPSAADAAAAVSEPLVTTTSGALSVVDDATVTFADSAASRTVRFARGFGDDALVAAGVGRSAVTGADVPQIDMLLRDAGPPAESRVPGAYDFFLVAAGGASGTGGKVLLSTRQIVGTAVLDASGRATYAVKFGHEALSDFPLDPSGWTERAASRPPAGNWSVANGAVRLSLSAGGVASVDLHPVMGGAVYVGVVGQTSGAGSEVGFLVLSRAGAGHSAAQLAGSNAVVSLLEVLRDRVIHAQGFGFPVASGVAVRAGDVLDLTIGSSFAIEHDLTTGVAFGGTSGGLMRHATFGLTTSGRYTDTGSAVAGENVVGFVTARGDLLFQTHAGDHFLEALIELPSVGPP